MQMANTDVQGPPNALLNTLEHLGEGTALAQQIFDMIAIPDSLQISRAKTSSA